MKIAYDAKRIFSSTSGLGNYSRDLVRILSHIFPENAQLDLIFWPEGGISSAPITHFYVEDRAELYPDGKREITLDLARR